VLEHSRARIDTDQEIWRADDLDRFARYEPGTDTNVDDALALGQPGPAQRLAAIPDPAAKGEDALDAVVVPMLSNMPRTNRRAQTRR
jgi:hypothetical protein